METLRIIDVGDCAFSVEFGDGVDPAVSARVTGLNHAIAQARAAGGLPGVVETIPSFRALLVLYDPLATSRREMEKNVRALAAQAGEAPAAADRLWTIPVCYDSDLGEDLADLAAQSGLSPGDAVTLHAGAEYRVYMLGFLPGFAYLGGLPEALRRPRRATPRVKVPAGSVAVADSLCAVYPWDSPGGWHLLGRTPAGFFDLERDPPSLLAAGDRVRFRPITRAEYEALRADPALVTPERLRSGGES